MKRAPINRIIPFSNVDGPGNRTSIFLQTCPFECLYCHNPETIKQCIHCGECVASCPVGALSVVEGKVVWDKATCVKCDTCLSVCKHMATPKIRYYTVKELVAKIEESMDYIAGITVSGGECMNHPYFLLDLFREVKKLGLTCLIDSNGAHDFENYPDLMKVCDGVMLDVKASNPDFHKELVHRPNDIVLKNLEYLQKINKLYEVRTVCLPNHQAMNKETVEYVSEHLDPTIRYKLIKYRPFGVREEGKQALGGSITSDELILELKQIAEEKGHRNVIII